MITKKTYKKLAEIFVNAKLQGENLGTITDLEKQLTDMLKEDNPRFSLDKWDEYQNKKLRELRV